MRHPCILGLFISAVALFGCGGQIGSQALLPTSGSSSASSGAGVTSTGGGASAAVLLRSLATTDLNWTYRTVNQWGGGYQGEIALTYGGSTTLQDWTVSFDLASSIQSIWNARLIQTTGSRQKLGPASYNASLKPGDKVVVGFVATGTPANPANLVMETNSAAPGTTPSPTPSTTPSPSPTTTTDLRGQFRRDSDWGTGFTGAIKVINASTQNVSGWRVTLTLASHLDSVWNATLISHQGDLYVFGPASYNGTIPAGQQIEFGFQASPTGTPTQITVTAGTASTPSPTPSPSPTITPSPSPSPTTTPSPTPTPGPQVAGYLHTQGSRILDAQNQVVVLRGVNWFGLETTNLCPHGLWTRSLDSMLDQIKGLGYNCLRIPFSNDVLRNSGKPNGIDFNLNPQLSGLTSLQILDQVVAGAGKRGLKVMLDRHRPDSSGQSELWYSASCSEQQWISDWETLALRYKDNPTVVAVDLHNEPHGSATWGDGNAATDWRLAAQKAGNRILQVNPNLLIVVEGIEKSGGTYYWWGGNLKGARNFPVVLQLSNHLVYSSHDYATSVFHQSWFDSANYPANLTALWDDHWGFLVKGGLAPVLVGEFGSNLQSTTDVTWMKALCDYLKTNGMSFTYWSWNPNSADTGGVLMNDWSTVDHRKQDILAPLL